MTLDISLYEEGVRMAGYREQRIKFGTNHFPIYKRINPYEKIDRRIKKDISHLQISKDRSETKTKKKKRAKRIKIKEKKTDLFELLGTLQPEKPEVAEVDKETYVKNEKKAEDKAEDKAEEDKAEEDKAEDKAEEDKAEEDKAEYKAEDKEEDKAEVKKDIKSSSDQKKTIRVSNVEPDMKKHGQALIL